MQQRFPKGLTLLEMVIYIGILAIALPGSVAFLLRLQDTLEQHDSRMRMEQTGALVFSEMMNKITAADAISISTSTLNAAQSVLRFTNDSGTAIIVDDPTTTVTFPGGTQSVHRLRMQTGAGPAVWLTDPEIDVTEWRVVALRNGSGTLTGLRISMDYAMLFANTDAYRHATFTGDTTISLQPHTLEN
jgi:hypothetical protein